MVLNPTTGAIEAMYSNPTFDPNPLVSEDLSHGDDGVGHRRLSAVGQPGSLCAR